VDYISVSNLQKISSKNLEKRAKEIISVEKIIDAAVGDFKQMIQERKIELAMREVPERVKAIKNNAIDNVFAKELEGLDESSKETVEKMMTYFEKKYMSVPMKMAKEILLKK
jgi:glutamyl-tRNA reductase